MSEVDLKNTDYSMSNASGHFGETYFQKLSTYVFAGLKNDKAIYGFITFYFLAGYAFLGYNGQISKSYFFIYFSVLFPLFIALLTPFFAVLTAYIIQRRAPQRQKLAFKAVTSPKNISRYLIGLAFLTLYCLFIGMFTSVKSSLGTVYGFQHDIFQADLDKALFFGVDAWKILFKPIHSLWTQPIIEFNYNILWHLHTYLVLFLMATSYQTHKLRKRYLISFMLVWVVIGNIFAGIFISAGPAFYGFLTGDEARFGEQLRLLATYEASSAVNFQNYLWTSYTSNTPGFGTGISAFPSIHVSICVLNTFFAFEISRKLGLLSLAYTIIILVSSVYLAWHYFVDGLFGAVLVAVIYYSMKYFISSSKAS